MNVHQGTRSIKVGRVGWFEHDYVCMYVCMYVYERGRPDQPLLLDGILLDGESVQILFELLNQTSSLS
jgi:hypothetical protein